jgi:two-component system invasion response regulator UvrY
MLTRWRCSDNALIKVLVADDHAIVRKGIELIIAETTDIVVTDEAKNGQEVLKKTPTNDFGIVPLDISMPGRDGFEILEELKSRQPKLTVLLLSIHAEKQYAVRALSLGAAGHLTKKSVPDELIKAIRKVAAGGKYISPSTAKGLTDKSAS